MDGKNSFPSLREEQIRIVKLTSIQFFVVGAVQRIIVAGLRCLNMQIIAVFRTVGGLLLGSYPFQRSIPDNGKALRLRHLLGSLRHFIDGFQIRFN